VVYKRSPRWTAGPQEQGRSYFLFKLSFSGTQQGVKQRLGVLSEDNSPTSVTNEHEFHTQTARHNISL
jgi:hypothetical protein